MQPDNSTSNNIPDMLSMMMQMLSNSNESENYEQAAQIQQAMHMAQMFEMFNSLNQPTVNSEEATPSKTSTPSSSTEDVSPPPSKYTAFYDTPILTPELIAIKSALPHIERRHQQSLGILVKLVELQRLIKFYESDADIQAQSNCNNLTTTIEHTRNMLTAIQANTHDETSRTKIDILLKAIDISELIQKIPRHHT